MAIKSNKSGKVLKINIELFIWVFLFMFLCTQFALNGHTIFSHISYILFVGAILILIAVNRKTLIHYNLYFNTYILFMAYSFVLAAIGFTVNIDSVITRLVYMLVNLLFYLALYNFILETEEKELLLKITIWAAVISLIFIMLNLEDIWTGRLGHSMDGSGPSFYVNNIPVFLTANAIALFTDIGALFALYFAGVKKKRIYFAPYLFLSFGTLLSGSRKGLLLLVLFTVFSLFNYFEGTGAKKILMVIVGAVVLYYIVIKIPAFYKAIGRRTELLVNSLLGGSAEEASMDSREHLAHLAISYIYEKPFFGWGLGNFSQLANSPYSVDNNYLDILVSCGIGGIVIYYYYIVLALRNYFSIPIKKRDIIVKSMFFVVVCFLVLDLGSVVYSIRNQLMWVVVFFAFITLDLKKKKSEIYISERGKK